MLVAAVDGLHEGLPGGLDGGRLRLQAVDDPVDHFLRAAVGGVAELK